MELLEVIREMPYSDRVKIVIDNEMVFKGYVVNYLAHRIQEEHKTAKVDRIRLATSIFRVEDRLRNLTTLNGAEVPADQTTDFVMKDLEYVTYIEILCSKKIRD